MTYILRILNQARKYQHKMILAILSMLILTAAELVAPLVVRQLVAIIQKLESLGQSGWGMINQLALLALGLYILRALASFGNVFLAHQVGWGTLSDIRVQLYEHLQKLSLRYYHDRQTGQITTRMISDLAMIEELISHAIPDIITSIILFIGATSILFWLDWRLALVTLIPIPILVYLVRNYGKKVHTAYHAAQQKLAEIGAKMQDNLSGISVIQSFNREEYELERFEEKSIAHYQSTMKTIWFLATRFPLVELTGSIGMILVIWYGGKLALLGQLSIANLVAFFLYLQYFYRPILQLGRVVDTVQRAAVGGKRIYEIIDTEPDIKDTKHAQKPKLTKHDIEFHNVTFAYKPGFPVLLHASFRIEDGETVALVGSSGAGKTTIINLIPRFYDPNEGKITLSGYDLRDLSVSYLRSKIALVLQEVFLFTGTVKENIAYGNLKATEAEIIAAAKAAHAHEFILELPQQYDTVIGERGVKLSGGQKQRISIARAILKNAPILILDEATSSVDSETELLIQDALKNLTANRTSIIIAHRLSTIQHADKIIVLEDGTVAEIGTHQELLDANGIYSRLYNLQYRLSPIF
ncbi:MAG: ABC transporter ATP-binding protein/permease [bacterium]|nr:ABC transporter ATP-binding protein/permease [bacterium]